MLKDSYELKSRRYFIPTWVSKTGVMVLIVPDLLFFLGGDGPGGAWRVDGP